MRIKQGDAYDVTITLQTDDGEPVSVMDGTADVVEVMIGRKLRKTCPGEIDEAKEFAWSGSGTGYLETLVGPYVNVEVVKGTGISGCFQQDDRIEIVFADPAAKPFKEKVQALVKGVYNDTDLSTEYLVLDGYVNFGQGGIPFTQDMSIYVLHPAEYVMPVTEKETFALSGTLPLEVRVKFTDDTVVGASMGVVTVDRVNSREVLRESNSEDL